MPSAFSTKATVEKLGSLVSKLQERFQRSRTKDDGSCVVGYSAPWAWYVHEDLSKKHPIGQAKFLSQPALERPDELRTEVVQNVKGGTGLVVANQRAAV